MSALKVLFIVAAFAALVHGDDEKEQEHAIFRECAEASGFKMEGAFKKGEKPTWPPPPEMLCTLKCTMEKKGVLVGGKIQTEEIRNGPKMLHHINPDKIDSFLECVKPLEIAECSDIQKVMECRVKLAVWEIVCRIFSLRLETDQ